MIWFAEFWFSNLLIHSSVSVIPIGSCCLSTILTWLSHQPKQNCGVGLRAFQKSERRVRGGAESVKIPGKPEKLVKDASALCFCWR